MHICPLSNTFVLIFSITDRYSPETSTFVRWHIGYMSMQSHQYIYSTTFTIWYHFRMKSSIAGQNIWVIWLVAFRYVSSVYCCFGLNCYCSWSLPSSSKRDRTHSTPIVHINSIRITIFILLTAKLCKKTEIISTTAEKL